MYTCGDMRTHPGLMELLVNDDGFHFYFVIFFKEESMTALSIFPRLFSTAHFTRTIAAAISFAAIVIATVRRSLSRAAPRGVFISFGLRLVKPQPAPGPPAAAQRKESEKNEKTKQQRRGIIFCKHKYMAAYLDFNTSRS